MNSDYPVYGDSDWPVHVDSDQPELWVSQEGLQDHLFSRPKEPGERFIPRGCPCMIQYDTSQQYAPVERRELTHLLRTAIHFTTLS